MSLPTSTAAYTDCYHIWDSASRSRGGTRTWTGPDLTTAQNLRFRLNMARGILREQSRRAFPTHDPAYNTSEFDAFKVTIRQDTEDNYWVYILPWIDYAAIRNTEPIPDEELDPEALLTIEHEPQKALPAPATPDPAPDLAE